MLSFMKLHRFYTRETIGGSKEISLSDEGLAHQLRNVFRLKTGDSIVLFDGSGFEYVSSITNLTNESVDVTIKDSSNTCFTPEKNIHILQSIVKKDNFEWILEKCTEIGANEFTPVISERTEKKNLNIERAEKILVEASEQSGRCAIPKLHQTEDLKDVLETHGKNLVVFHLDGEKFDKKDFAKSKDVKVLVGPEGGWSEREVEEMKKVGVKIYTLGKQVLRAETAVIAISTLFLL